MSPPADSTSGSGGGGGHGRPAMASPHEQQPVCKAGLNSVRRIWLTRHGESLFNSQGSKIGGDSGLSERGERYARCLPEALISRLPQDLNVSVAVWTSTLKRTIQTARNLPFPKLRWKALDEINAGSCDGMTYAEIAKRMPAEFEARKKDKLRYRYPAGESYLDVIQRVEPVVIEMEREKECLVVVAHQAVLRAVYGYLMGVPPEDIPGLHMPLHTLIELTPMPDGTMNEQRFEVDINNVPPEAAAGGGGGAGPDGADEGLVRSRGSISIGPASPVVSSRSAYRHGAGAPPSGPTKPPPLSAAATAAALLAAAAAEVMPAAPAGSPPAAAALEA